MPAPAHDGDVQQHPTPPAPPLPVLDIQKEPPVALAGPDADRFRQSAVVTKLRVLLRCHAAVRRAARLRLLARAAVFLAAMLAGAALGTLLGVGVFWAIYDDPYRHVQSYNVGFGTTYYVRGRQASRQEYDYFLATNSNHPQALMAAIPAGLVLGLAVPGVIGLVLLLRGRKAPVNAALEDQIAAIVNGHPEAVHRWGGPSVLRQPEMVAEVVRIEEAGLLPAAGPVVRAGGPVGRRRKEP
jgi:hypothetical protein